MEPNAKTYRDVRDFIEKSRKAIMDEKIAEAEQFQKIIEQHPTK